MRWRQVIVLYAVAAALGMAYRGIEPPPPVAPEGPPPRPRFLTLDPDDLREVRLQRPGRRIVVQRSGDRWDAIEPPGVTVPSDLIAAFTRALASTEEIERVSDKGADAHAYGLDDDAARIELVPAGGASVVVMLGTTNPTGTALYARRGDAPEVVLIGRDVAYYEDLIFQSLPVPPVPADEEGGPIGG